MLEYSLINDTINMSFGYIQSIGYKSIEYTQFYNMINYMFDKIKLVLMSFFSADLINLLHIAVIFYMSYETYRIRIQADRTMTKLILTIVKLQTELECLNNQDFENVKKTNKYVINMNSNITRRLNTVQSKLSNIASMQEFNHINYLEENYLRPRKVARKTVRLD